MSFTPEPGTPLAQYYAQTQPRIGAVLSRRSLGTVDAVTIGRYAMTIGATDPSHYDREAAGRRGTPTSSRHPTCSPRSSNGASVLRNPACRPTGRPSTVRCHSGTATSGCA